MRGEKMSGRNESDSAVSFNSFLAGVLLTRTKISNFIFFNLLNSFEKTYNVSVISEGNLCDEESDIYLPIYLDDTSIVLRKNYDDILTINGKRMTVKDYLYGLTCPEVREYFNILKKGSNLKNGNKKILRMFLKKA